MRRRREPDAISDDEQIARYAYVLGSVPASVADRAYAAAFTCLSAGERERVVTALRAALPEEHPHPIDSPYAFARLLRDLHARAALSDADGGVRVAAEFVLSAPVVAYFTAGVGSVSMDRQPPWIHDLAGYETAPVDGGRIHHRKGATWGHWYES